MEINGLLFFTLLILMLTLGATLGFFYARQKSSVEIQNVNSEASSLREKIFILQGENAQLTASNQELSTQQEQRGDLLRTLAPIQKQLELMHRQVHELDQHTTGTSEKLMTQLANDAKLQAELRATANELNAALRSSSARGNWGEVQLQRILEAAGMLMHVDFNLQQTSATISSSEKLTDTRNLRPDAIIHLPNGGKLAIDAKVPLAAYLKAQAVEGTSTAAENQRNEYLSAHAKALAGHVKTLVKRNYPADFPDSPQITILFIPSEALLSEALKQDATLLENSLRNGVVLTSPSSLLALLRAVAAIWASSAATTEAAKIVDLGRTLIDRLNVTTKHLNSLGKSLTSSVKHYNLAIGSLESRVLATAREFTSIDTTGLELNKAPLEIDTDKAQVREIVSPDLINHIDDARNEKDTTEDLTENR